MKIFLQDIKTSGHRIEYAGYLARYFIQDGHDVFYYTCGTDDRINHLKDLGVTINTFPTVPTMESTKDVIAYQVQLFRYYRSAFSVADSWGADIVHQLCMNSIEIPLLPTLLERQDSDWRFFATYFAVRLDTGSVGFPKQIFRYCRRFAIKNLVNRNLIDGLFVHHEALRDDLIGLIQTSPSFISVIPDPIDPPTTQRTQSEAREELSLPKDDTIILFFGSARYNKGPDILLDSLRYLNEAGVTVVFAGKEGYINRNSIESVIKETGHGVDFISKFEFIPDNQINTYFNAADAVAIPYRSEYTGTSGVLQRSIASERPIIGTDCGIVGSIIKNWNMGVCVPPDSPEKFAEGIGRYLENKEDYDQQSTEGAAEYVDIHHWENLGKKVLESYNGNNSSIGGGLNS